MPLLAPVYDAYLAHPRLVRLATWARLERTPAGRLFAEADDAPKIETIAQAQRDGHIDPALLPADVHSMVISLAMTWSPGSLTYTATATDQAADHERRRASRCPASDQLGWYISGGQGQRAHVDWAA
jgi:hypothetical protein